MASVERTVELIFAGIDQTSPTLKSISGGLRAIDGAVQAVADPFAKVFDTVVKVDAALAALAAGTLTAAIIQSGKLGDSFNEISTLIDAPAADLAAFKQEIIEYGRASTASFAEIHSATYTAISAGTDYTQSLALVASAEQLATAGRGELDSTTKLLAGTLNAYGAEVDETQRYSDAMFQTIRDGLTTLPELAANLGKVTTDAALAKVPIETLGAAISALTAANLDTTVSTTALRALLKSIVDPSDQAAKAAEALGIEFSGAALASRGLDGILRQVQDTTGGNVDKLKELFDNTRSYTAAAVLSSDQSGVFAKSLQHQADKAGVLDVAFAKMANNFDQVNQTTLNSLQATLAQVGDPLLDQYKDLAEALAAVSAAMGKSITAGDMDPLFNALNSWGEDLETWLQGVAAALPQALAGLDLGGFLDALRKLGDEFGLVFAGIDLTTPAGLQQALQTVVDGLTSLTHMTRGIVEEFGPIAVKIGDVLGWLSRMNEDTAVLLGKASAVGKLVKEFGTIMGVALASFGGPDIVYTDYGDGLLYIGDSADTAGEKVDAFVDKTAGVVTAAGKLGAAAAAAVTPIAELAKAEAEMGAAAGASAPQVEELTSASDKSLTSVDKLRQAYDPLVQNMRDLADEAAQGGPALERFSAAELEASIQTDGFVIGLDGVIRNVGSLDSALPGTTQEVERVGDALSASAADSDTLRLGMAQLATDLAATTYQANIDLQVAQVQAEAQQIEATFDALETALTSSSSTIVALFGQLGSSAGSGNIHLQNQLNQALTTQQTQQAAAHQITMTLAQSQINALNARTQAIQQGGGVIQIDGTGLSPALQMVMWEIIEEVQVRANQSAADFILGIV